MVFFVFTAYLAVAGSGQILMKSVADELPRAKALAVQFLCAAILGWAIALFMRDIRLERELLIIVGVGFINAFGAFAQWEAIGISLSKTAILYPLSGVLTAALAALFLKEAELYANSWLVGGVLLLFVAAFLLNLGKKNKKSKEASDEIPAKKRVIKWAIAIAAMVAIFGIVQFMMKAFAVDGIGKVAFISHWYSGAFLGSLGILAIAALRKQKDQRKFFGEHTWKLPLLATFIFLNLGATYWAFQVAPAGVVAPLFNFAQAVLPIGIGLLIFHERKGLKISHTLGFLLGLMGILAIAIGFY
ncbi:MAG: hypothetical protein HYW95_01715 [Candidatus Wildermuthbacteria bacterium]|nr:hypothetical protein [Candidatus Wildermuthbacteria bacterium]